MLLIDCDLSTNGATYFYEEKLASKKNHIASFQDVLIGKRVTKLKCIEIDENYHFMPSITQITKKSAEGYVFKPEDSFVAYRELCQKYEVILFDCQAGYTDVLRLILPITDINLVVMETDAISSSSIRSLYLKIGDIVNEKKLYQVFNKASKEEYEIYSKVSGGTVFTNIDTILFDWKIRKAFAVSQIPDMENTSANYGTQIYNLCTVLFVNQTIQQKLQKFKAILDLHSYQETENTIKSKIDALTDMQHKKRSSLTKGLTLAISLVCAITVCIVFMSGLIPVDTLKETSMVILLPTILALGTTVLAGMNILESTKEKREYSSEISLLKRQLYELDKKRINVRQQLEKTAEKDQQNK